MENDALSTVTGPARPCESHRTRLSRWTSRPATLSPRHLLGRWSRRGGSTMILESGIRARSNSRQSPGARQTQNVLSAASEFRNCTKQSRQQLIDDGDGHRRYVTSDGEETVRDHRGRELLTSRASARRTGRPLSRGPRRPIACGAACRNSPRTDARRLVPFRSAGGPRARPATPTRSNHNDGTRRNDASGAAARRPAYSSRSRGGGVRRHPPELPWNQPVARQRSARRSDRPGGRFSIGRLYRSSSPSTGSLRNPIYPTMLVGFLGLCHYGADSKAATTMTLV